MRGHRGSRIVGAGVLLAGLLAFGDGAGGEAFWPLVAAVGSKPALASEAQAPLAQAGPGPCPAGLQSWWRAENGFDDSGPAQNRGTKMGNVGFQSGLVQQAFRFPGGIGDYVAVNDAYNLRPDGQFTLEAWVNPGSIDGYQGLVIKNFGGFWMGAAA